MMERNWFVRNFISLLMCWFMFVGGCATNKRKVPKIALAEADLGVSLVRQGKLRAGLKHLLAADRHDPKNERIKNEIGLIYRDLKLYGPSLKYFKEALAIRGEFPEAWNNMGTVYLVLGEWDKAIACFKRALKITTYLTPHFAYNNLGYAYYNLGLLAKAVSAYWAALDLAPDYSLCWYNLGIAYEAMSRAKQAEMAFGKAIKYAPEFAVAHLHLAKTYLKQGEVQKAKRELKVTIQLAHGSTIATEAEELLNAIE